MKKGVGLGLALLHFTLFLFAQTDIERREEYLREQLKVNDPRDHRASTSLRVTFQDSTWFDWQKRTGELPPDFSKLTSCYDLPDPLELEGEEITTLEQWNKKKEWIKEQYQYWISGLRPPAPTNLKYEIVEEQEENSVIKQKIKVSFGPEHQGKITCELFIPKGEGLFPVYLTQNTHRDWAQLALRRGYLACIYNASDSNDDTQNYQSIYPDYDFSCLMRRAWAASRIVDYLYTRDDVDKAKIAITGHSRRGKQSLWTAAFDERISAVITCSSGTGGVTPCRYSDPPFCNQTLDDIASKSAHWFHPRLRFFFGREDKLPVDQNLLLSLIAPRPLLIHYSYVERQINPWAYEQCYRSTKKVYAFLDAEDNIGIYPRMGNHALATRDIERCIDFLDIKFDRKKIPWENKTFYDWDFEDWRARQGAEVRKDEVVPVFLSEGNGLQTLEKQKDNIRNNLLWLLGDQPPGVSPDRVAETHPTRVDWMDQIMIRPEIKRCSLIKIGPYTSMGDHLPGYLYCPKGNPANKKFPVVIFLHQYAHAHGFTWGYTSDNCEYNTLLFQAFVDNGFAVLAIDLLGFGTRIEEGSLFYDRYPQWSKMGNMVADARACVDAMVEFDCIDREKIFLLGNSIGGTVALLSASLDQRVTGVAVVSGFTPWRSNDYPSAIKIMADLHGFIPRLGLWKNQPDSVPVDFPEILSCIAPRPLMIIAPELDRHANQTAVKQCMASVTEMYKLFGKEDNLQFDMPLEISRLTNDMRSRIIQFFKSKCCN